MAQALQTHGVISDVVDKVPASVLNVTYPNNVVIEIGKVLTPTQVKDQPAVQWDGEANAFYTLCMTGKWLSLHIFTIEKSWPQKLIFCKIYVNFIRSYTLPYPL